MEDDRDPSRSTLIDEEKFEDFSDIDVGDLNPSSSPVGKRTRRILTMTTIAILLLIPTVYLTLSSRPPAQTEYTQCGTSAASARARNCVFEPTGFTWMPRACHDAITEREFLAYTAVHDLKLFRDPDYTDVVTPEEVARGDGAGYFVREGYHLAHCMFLFKELHRAYARGGVVDGYVVSLNHTEHCVGQSLSAGKDAEFTKDMIQFSYIKWPNCGRAGGHNLIWKRQGE
jgi:hypothetical protein